MKTYLIKATETRSNIYHVKADSLDEARDNFYEWYQVTEIIQRPTDYISEEIYSIEEVTSCTN